MSEKVAVSKELADAIEHVRNNCRMERLCRYVDGEGAPSHPKVVLALRELDKDSLLHALFYGYKIEKTPHDLIKEKYSVRRANCRYNSGYKKGVEETLNILGIKIEGVNAN